MIIKLLKKSDPSYKLADLVMFDGAKNVQNGGKIIHAFNPRILSIHGGEHASGLFFGDAAKLNPIKVQYFDFCLHIFEHSRLTCFS